MDDLVQRLRRADEYEPLGHDAWEAADEIARLRAALRNIDAIDPESMVNGCGPDALRGLVNRMGEIARGALEQNKPETRISEQWSELHAAATAPDDTWIHNRLKDKAK